MGGRDLGLNSHFVYGPDCQDNRWFTSAVFEHMHVLLVKSLSFSTYKFRIDSTYLSYGKQFQNLMEIRIVMIDGRASLDLHSDVDWCKFYN